MMSQNTAETHALRVLAWLVGHEELLSVFLGSTGMGEADLKQRAADPEVLAAVMDFLLMDDSWVLSCAEALGENGDVFVQIRASLPGGEQVNWT